MYTASQISVKINQTIHKNNYKYVQKKKSGMIMLFTSLKKLHKIDVGRFWFLQLLLDNLRGRFFKHDARRRTRETRIELCFPVWFQHLNILLNETLSCRVLLCI